MVPSINIPGTTPQCLVSTGGDFNILGTRNLIYERARSHRLVASLQSVAPSKKVR